LPAGLIDENGGDPGVRLRKRRRIAKATRYAFRAPARSRCGNSTAQSNADKGFQPNWSHRGPARVFDAAHSLLQVRMLCRAGQHGAGHAKIIVLPRQAIIDSVGVAHLHFQAVKVLIRASAHRFINHADLFGLVATQSSV
jgi:hypothetical protein